MSSQKRTKAAITLAREHMQAARQEALGYWHVYDSLVNAFGKADECLALGAISPRYAEDVKASLTEIHMQISAVEPSKVSELAERAWAIRNCLLQCHLAQQNLDQGFLSNEEAWAACLKEYGIEASEVKKR